VRDWKKVKMIFAFSLFLFIFQSREAHELARKGCTWKNEFASKKDPKVLTLPFYRCFSACRFHCSKIMAILLHEAINGPDEHQQTHLFKLVSGPEFEPFVSLTYWKWALFKFWSLEPLVSCPLSTLKVGMSSSSLNNDDNPFGYTLSKCS
jgi:hypothetical protein